MTNPNLPKAFLHRLSQVTGKRSRIVIDHILQHGSISTEELEQLYGYKHPPRAVKDVRDQGIPIETFSIKSSDGRTIAAYRFGDPTKVREGRLGGRTTFSRRFKNILYSECDGKCAICDGNFALRELQIDHRIPYEIAGDPGYAQDDSKPYMLVCGPCNRAKSWSCENCPNWKTRMAETCHSCYWAYPGDYRHVAMEEIRRSDIIWNGNEEAELYDELVESASQHKQSIQERIKSLLRNIMMTILKLFT